MRKLPGLIYIKRTAHSSNTTHREHTVRQLKYSRRYCNSTAAYTTHRDCSAVHTKHRKYTARQLKYHEYTAAYIKDRNCTAVHTKHR